MKKIIIDARESGTSTGRYIDKLIEYLHQLTVPYKITILTKKHRVDYIKSIAPKFEVIESNFKEFTFSEQLLFWRQLHHMEKDLVHFAMVQQPILYRGKKVATIHDLTTARFRNPAKNWLIFTIKREVYKFVIRSVARKSLKIIAPTEFVQEDVAKFAGINSSKIVVTNEAVDDFDEPAEPVQDFEGKKFIMFNGRPTPHKNLRRLIEAFAILAPKHPDLYLMLAGKKDGSYRSYIKLIDSLDLSDRVILTDFIPDGQLKWAMQHTRAYIWASLSEGFGLPPLEAMQYGAPVVSSNASCMPEVLGDAAHYFDPTNVDDMASKINDVLTKPALRKSLIEKGKKQTKKYSWKRMAEQTLEVYKEVLEK